MRVEIGDRIRITVDDVESTDSAVVLDIFEDDGVKILCLETVVAP